MMLILEELSFGILNPSFLDL